MEKVFPEFIRNLPHPELPDALLEQGADVRLLRGENQQAAFFRLPAGFVIPPHAHCAQWGVLLDGEMELTISGETRTVRAGEHYFIPADAEHQVRCVTEIHALDFFDDGQRYQEKR